MKILRRLRNKFGSKEKLPVFKLPEEWKIKPDEKILLLAPHPDDEVIGCGGLLAKYGRQCDVVLLTDGRYGDPDISADEVIKIRRREFISVMDELKVNCFCELGIEDLHLIDNGSKFSEIDFSGYDYILMPSPKDFHPDHMAVSYLYNKLKNKGRAVIVYYEVWNVLAEPNFYIDISEVFEEKKVLINKYASQVKHIDYASRILALNHYRGILYNIGYAECYQRVHDTKRN